MQIRNARLSNSTEHRDSFRVTFGGVSILEVTHTSSIHDAADNILGENRTSQDHGGVHRIFEIGARVQHVNMRRNGIVIGSDGNGSIEVLFDGEAVQELWKVSCFKFAP